MSIIKRVDEISGNSTLIFGRAAEGKTSAILAAFDNDTVPLWVTFTNVAPLIASGRYDFDIAQISTWAQFEKELYAPLTTGAIDISIYNTIVLDGLNVAAALYMGEINKATQQDWGIMGKKFAGIVAKLQDLFEYVYVTIDIVEAAKENEGDHLAINRDLSNQILPRFDNKWYAYVQPTDDGIEYLIQKNPTYAVKFRPMKRSKKDEN